MNRGNPTFDLPGSQAASEPGFRPMHALSVFSQKLTSWVFNDQPCECADVGQSRTIGRAAKIGWEKKLLRK